MRGFEPALRLLACLGLSGGCGPPAHRIEIGDPKAHWPGGEFAEMVPAIRLPTSIDARDHITVWLHIPRGGRIGVRVVRGRPMPAYPPGTIADRIEIREPAEDEAAHTWAVADVRGTTVGERGEQRFHCLQPSGVGGSLVGFEWTRGDEAAERVAADGLAVIASARLAGAPDDIRAATAERLRRLSHCALCHEPERPARARNVERGPRRPTDAAGFYGILSVLYDAAPLEEHRPRELNGGDPFTTISCGPVAAVAPGPRAHFVCADGGIAVATFDVARALAAGQPHALATCRSRRYLFDHMDDTARALFAAAFAECGPGHGSP